MKPHIWKDHRGVLWICACRRFSGQALTPFLAYAAWAGARALADELRVAAVGGRA
ncbi:hypothetical protein G3O06_26865 [Burkholderia sp. Ac-20345]|uniref:hypothetical protein n=1 Tax=Burkholderia sp. Ac-20345 TaxID=2703891 RepID=UPI00197C352A|nr:hypothetical protein [Burkholderia sp. Ac-20345]MBN3781138.1 hypothetical protein [Burkholderia sp. Ac-20345]